MDVKFADYTVVFAHLAVCRLLRDSELYVEVPASIRGHLVRAMHDFERIDYRARRPRAHEDDQETLKRVLPERLPPIPLDVEFAAATIPIAKVAIEIWIRRGVVPELMRWLTPALEDLDDIQRRLVEAVRSESEAIAAALADELAK